MVGSYSQPAFLTQDSSQAPEVDRRPHPRPKVGNNSSWKERSSMPIRTIPLSRLETDLKKTLSECAESGETLVVEMPDQRLLAIRPLDLYQEDDSLIDELLASNPKFQALVANSKASPRKPFALG